MSWYYDYYICMQDKDTKKIDVFAPFDSLGKLHSVFNRSRSFASDLYESFHPVNDLLTEDAIRKLWRSCSDPESEITEEDLGWIKNYTSYLPYSELPNGDYLKKGYFLLEDILHHVDAWQREHEGCTLIGVCYEENDYTDNDYFHPVIYEDENGNRYWTHFDIETLKEYLDMEDKDD